MEEAFGFDQSLPEIRKSKRQKTASSQVTAGVYEDPEPHSGGIEVSDNESTYRLDDDPPISESEGYEGRPRVWTVFLIHS